MSYISCAFILELNNELNSGPSDEPWRNPMLVTLFAIPSNQNLGPSDEPWGIPMLAVILFPIPSTFLVNEILFFSIQK